MVEISAELRQTAIATIQAVKTAGNGLMPKLFTANAVKVQSVLPMLAPSS